MALSEHLDRACAALDAGDAQGAARALRLAALAPTQAWGAVDVRRLLGLVARLGQAAGLADLATQARSAWGDPESLYRTGYELIEVGLHDVAVPVLTHLDRLEPGRAGVLSELVSALERSGRHGEARDLLLCNASLLDDPWLRYLLCFNALCDGDLATTRAHAGQLAATGGDDGSADAVARIHAMLARADRLAGLSPLDRRDLRGWHYVLNGSVLAHLSPYGFDEGMNGRYAWIQDSVGAIRRDLEAVRVVLAAWGELPERVLALPEHGSRIVAGALGAVLGCRVQDHRSGADGVLALYDPADLPPQLGDRAADHAGPVVARACCWTRVSPVVPDVVGLLHQSLTPPWGALLRHDPAGGTRRSEPSADPPRAWVERIAAEATGEAPDTEQDRVDPPGSLEAFARAASRDRGDRSWDSSPVPSSRFF